MASFDPVHGAPFHGTGRLQGLAHALTAAAHSRDWPLCVEILDAGADPNHRDLSYGPPSTKRPGKATWRR